jgi:lysosomal Pro-X carboxypeptidase
MFYKCCFFLFFSGTHTLDILAANENDPEWLVIQRKKEVEIIQGWIMQYYAELDASMEWDE